MLAKNDSHSPSQKRNNKNDSGSNKKKFKNGQKNKKKTENKDSNTDLDDDDLDEILSKDQIQYNMPKPGPHAKAGEWRKWKMMKRAIRQQREEKKIIKQQELDEKRKKEEEIKKSQSEVKKIRNFTISIAVPGSIIGKVQSKELKTYVAGQIARAATLFCVDEIIVYNEYALENKQQNENNEQLIKILEYLECPQYLRKLLFPPHKYLEHVGLLHPLEAPHHFKINDEWDFREGVVTDIPTKENKGSWVDIGLLNKIQIDKQLQAGVRVTVKKQETSSGKLKGIVVSPDTPRVENGSYWGYQVRYASAFRKIIYESSFNAKYDLKIGINLNGNKLSLDHIDKLPNSNHVLIVFGGLNGIEAAIEADEKLRANNVKQVFNLICESDKIEHSYGSRSVRLEEAVLISLAVLKPKIIEANKYETNLDEIDEFNTANENNDEEKSQEEDENDESNSINDDEKEENSSSENNDETSENND